MIFSEEHFGEYNSAQRDKIQILVPGAGLGRLAYEIASRGYTCQGNHLLMDGECKKNPFFIKYIER